MVAAVGRLRLREVRQIARRERRRDRRHGEHEEAKSKELGDAGAMCGSNHGTTSANKNSASPGSVRHFCADLHFRRKFVDSTRSVTQNISDVFVLQPRSGDNREGVIETRRLTSPTQGALSGRHATSAYVLLGRRAVFVGSARIDIRKPLEFASPPDTSAGTSFVVLDSHRAHPFDRMAINCACGVAIHRSVLDLRSVNPEGGTASLYEGLDRAPRVRRAVRRTTGAWHNPR